MSAKLSTKLLDNNVLTLLKEEKLGKFKSYLALEGSVAYVQEGGCTDTRRMTFQLQGLCRGGLFESSA